MVEVGAGAHEGEGPGEDRAAEGLAHLQAAARELIQAARAVLDVAEGLVEDPRAVTAVADAVGSIVKTAAGAGRRAAGLDDGTGEDSGGVQRIRVE